MSIRGFQKAFCLVLILFCVSIAETTESGKVMTFDDVMKFKSIINPLISEDGRWVVYEAVPDRGNGEVIICHVKTAKNTTIKYGSKPQISKDGEWISALLKPDVTKKSSEEKGKSKTDMALVKSDVGEIITFKKVKKAQFSGDSKWLLIEVFPPLKKETNGDAKEEKKNTKDQEKISSLILYHLSDGKKEQVVGVKDYALDPDSKFLVYSLSLAEGKGVEMVVRNLKQDHPGKTILIKEQGIVLSHFTWSKKGSQLAFISTVSQKKSQDKPTKSQGKLMIWDGKKGRLIQAVVEKQLKPGWVIPSENKLTWTRDGKRLYFGTKPLAQMIDKKDKETIDDEQKNAKDYFNPEKILENKTLDVWHYQDPYIIPHQKKRWKKEQKRTYAAMYQPRGKKWIQLADLQVPEIRPCQDAPHVLALSGIPYSREQTWDSWYYDYYLVSVKDGSKKKVLTRQKPPVSLSPLGKYLLYYRDKHWHVINTRTMAVTNITGKIPTPFYDEDHDYPEDVPSYWLAGWLEKDGGVLIYDKYDIWLFNPGKGEAVNLTAGYGRKNRITFRVLTLDPEQPFLQSNQILLLSAYNNETKSHGFYQARMDKVGVTELLSANKKFRFLKKAAKAERLIYTRESFKEFPDIWISDLNFISGKKISDVNPQTKSFSWGEADLIEWRSMDGIRLQGVVLKPENFNSDKRYPVLVYYYRFFSQRLYEFNQPVINHRPCFPFYTSNGYVIFLPDIRFEVGHPGFSASKCLVPGVQKLIDLGIADPKAIALHGHSWSGYQTAFVITQTNIFSAAIAGAPVANMTSAYSGIRWGSGLARQLQYEKSQSRIGGSLWEVPELYIENSPVFFADRIQTPLLIQFGDEDGAVPWYQGIELYLAMRRLNKDCIFLQYRKEPHHLKKYANKLDYAMKMKEYLDHYLKGRTAPTWIKDGVPYRGR